MMVLEDVNLLSLETGSNTAQEFHDYHDSQEPSQVIQSSTQNSDHTPDLFSWQINDSVIWN